MGVKARAAFLLDRTAVLFVGLALGATIAFSFSGNGGEGSAAFAAMPPVTNASAVTASAAPTEIAAVVTPRLASAAVEGRRIHVGVFGDSFGDGIHASLYGQLRARDNFEVHKFSHPATGFTRYRTTNLLDDTRRRIAQQPLDVAVVSFGANDMQGIYLDGRGSEFMSDRWKAIVAQRAGEIVQLLRDQGAAVYWVGLPRMRDPAYDRNVQLMNAFYAERMRALNVPFVDTLSRSVDANGAYSPYLHDPLKGEKIMARTNDGIHMTIPGYYLLTRNLADRIRQSVSDARVGGGRQARNAAPETRSQG